MLIILLSSLVLKIELVDLDRNIRTVVLTTDDRVKISQGKVDAQKNVMRQLCTVIYDIIKSRLNAMRERFLFLFPFLSHSLSLLPFN